MNQAKPRSQALLDERRTPLGGMRHAKNVLRCARTARTSVGRRFGAADTVSQFLGPQDARNALTKHVDKSGVWARSTSKDAYAAAAQVRTESHPSWVRKRWCTRVEQ